MRPHERLSQLTQRAKKHSYRCDIAKENARAEGRSVIRAGFPDQFIGTTRPPLIYRLKAETQELLAELGAVLMNSMSRKRAAYSRLKAKVWRLKQERGRLLTEESRQRDVLVEKEKLVKDHHRDRHRINESRFSPSNVSSVGLLALIALMDTALNYSALLIWKFREWLTWGAALGISLGQLALAHHAGGLLAERRDEHSKDGSDSEKVWLKLFVVSLGVSLLGLAVMFAFLRAQIFVSDQAGLAGDGAPVVSFGVGAAFLFFAQVTFNLGAAAIGFRRHSPRITGLKEGRAAYRGATRRIRRIDLRLSRANGKVNALASEMAYMLGGHLWAGRAILEHYQVMIASAYEGLTAVADAETAAVLAAQAQTPLPIEEGQWVTDCDKAAMSLLQPISLSPIEVEDTNTTLPASRPDSDRRSKAAANPNGARSLTASQLKVIGVNPDES